MYLAAQYLAAAGISFVEKKDDDSHTNLSYDAFGDRIYGRWIAGPQGNIILGLNLRTFQFEWLDNKLNVFVNIFLQI